MIKAVIFDMDGLLIDSEPLWARAFKEAYKTIDVAITDEDMQEVRGKRQPESIEYFYRKFGITGHSVDDMEKVIRADMKNLIKSEGKLMPGVHHALEICQQAGLPLAIASSSVDSIINVVMDTLEIRDFFEHIYSAEHEKLGKPYPGVFITTASLLDVIPEYCLVFEDAPAGVLAAKAAKMKCIAVPEPAQKNDPWIGIADVVMSSLEEFNEEMLNKL